jgi:uncharacterized integral membrane protein
MFGLIIIVISGLFIAYFATQNTAHISVNFFSYIIPNIPTYFVVVGALLVGLLLGWIIGLVNEISAGFTLMGKDNKIKDYKKENAAQAKQIHQPTN